MSLKTIAGKLLRTAGNKLALFCECCIRYCCVDVGPPDECGNREKECQPCPNGPKPNCVEPCPARPPCVLQCVEIGVTACDDPVYDCVHSTKITGIPVETCDECPEPPPCEGYYCCFESEPSQDPNSPWPVQACQLGPCEGIELYSSGPHLTLSACNAVCKNYYCCYEYAPSENPEAPLPPSFCQEGPCADPTLQAGGPYPTLAQCSCRCCKKTFCLEKVKDTYERVYPGFGAAFCLPPYGPGCPVNDAAPGTIAVSADGGLYSCGRVLDEQYSFGGWEYRCPQPPPDLEVGDTASLPKHYFRLRVVDDCSECIDDGVGAVPNCDLGIHLVSCLSWDDAPQWMRGALCNCPATAGLTYCDNPLP